MALGRNIEVRVLGDAYQLEAELGRASKSLAQFGGDANAAADAQIQAGIRSREDLAKLAAAFQAEADAAVKGSDRQIIASRRAAEANGQLARLNQGYAAQNVRSAEESSAAWGRAGGGMLAFAKQAAFFGAGYLGFVGLKASLDAVLAAQTSIGQRNQAIQNAHADLGKLLPILQRYEELARKKGFDDNQTRVAEAELVTAFGATRHSLGELVVAENLARTSKQDLATATKGLILLQEGNTRAAKQYGLALPDETKAVWEAKASHDGLTLSQEKGKTLYDELLPRIKAQAQAFADTPTGKMQEFHAELQHIEETVGNDLLPTVTRYLTLVDAWLAKGDNQKRITHDVETVVHDLSTALEDAYTAGKDFLDAATPIVHMLGGWKTVLEAIIGLKFASSVAGWISPLQKLIGTDAAAGAAGASGLGGASSLSGRLLTNMKGLAKLGALTLGVDMIIKASGDKGAKGFLESLFGAGLVGFSFGGPTGALALAGIDLIVHASASSSSAPDAGGASLTYNGVTYYSIKGTHGEVELQEIAQRIREGKPLLAWQKKYLRYLQSEPGGSSGSGGVGDPGTHTVSTGSPTSNAIVRAGERLGGKGGGTYVRGGGHTSGEVKVGSALDCSGFVYQSLLRAGVKGFSYGTARDQFAALQRGGGGNWAATEVGVSGAEPGDIVYWDNLTSEKQPGHCGIVVSGKGSGAKVMQYEDPKDGSGIGGINEYPVMGVFRVKIIKGRPAGSGSPYGPSQTGQAASQSSAAAVKAITGSSLISEGLRNLIANAANHATTAHGAAVMRWLRTEIDDLEEAKRQLEQKLKGSTGAQRTAIQDELRTVDGQIARVRKQLSSAVAAWARGELAQIESKADSAFERATQAHIQNVLAPRFFQGVDANGNRRLTPSEALLQKMQQEDQQKSLQDALTQAQQQLAKDQAGGADAATLAADQQAVDAAERQITEDQLATKATEERAKADADYAKAVRKYEAERAVREKALNAALLKFTENLGKGAVAIGALAKLLERYGLPGDTVHLKGEGKTRIPVHHVHHHHHHGHPGHPVHGHHTGTGVPLASRHDHQTIIIELDGRKLGSALAPRSDQVVRVKLS